MEEEKTLRPAMAGNGFTWCPDPQEETSLVLLQAQRALAAKLVW